MSDGVWSMSGDVWSSSGDSSVTVQKEEILLKVDLFLSVQGRRSKSMLKIYSWEILLNIVTNTDENVYISRCWVDAMH